MLRAKTLETELTEDPLILPQETLIFRGKQGGKYSSTILHAKLKGAFMSSGHISSKMGVITVPPLIGLII